MVRSAPSALWQSQETAREPQDLFARVSARDKGLSATVCVLTRTRPHWPAECWTVPERHRVCGWMRPTETPHF